MCFDQSGCRILTHTQTWNFCMTQGEQDVTQEGWVKRSRFKTWLGHCVRFSNKIVYLILSDKRYFNLFMLLQAFGLGNQLASKNAVVTQALLITIKLFKHLIYFKNSSFYFFFSFCLHVFFLSVSGLSTYPPTCLSVCLLVCLSLIYIIIIIIIYLFIYLFAQPTDQPSQNRRLS